MLLSAVAETGSGTGDVGSGAVMSAKTAQKIGRSVAAAAVAVVSVDAKTAADGVALGAEATAGVVMQAVVCKRRPAGAKRKMMGKATARNHTVTVTLAGVAPGRRIILKQKLQRLAEDGAAVKGLHKHAKAKVGAETERGVGPKAATRATTQKVEAQ